MNARELLWRQLTLLLKVIEGFDSCNVFISALELTTFIFYILLFVLIDFFTFNPQRLCDCIGWEIHMLPIFLIEFLGLQIRQHM